MVRVSFTENLQRHLSCPQVYAEGDTVSAVLQDIFRDNAGLRSYLLDDQGRLRQHVAVYINDRLVGDRDRLTDPVADADEVFVFQALSGG